MVRYSTYREQGTIVAPELTSKAAVQARVSSSSAHFELSLAAGSGSCRASLEQASALPKPFESLRQRR